MSSSRLRKTYPSAPVPPVAAAAPAVTGAAAAGLIGTGLASGAGGIAVTQCAPDDTSFYCRFTRFIGIIKMVIFLLVLLAVIALVWYLWRRRKSNAQKGGGRRI